MLHNLGLLDHVQVVHISIKITQQTTWVNKKMNFSCPTGITNLQWQKLSFHITNQLLPSRQFYVINIYVSELACGGLAVSLTKHTYHHSTKYVNPLTSTVECWRIGTAIKHLVPHRVKLSFVIFDIQALWHSGLSQSAQMSKITNDGLTQCGTGCFIAVPIYHSGRQRVKSA